MNIFLCPVFIYVFCFLLIRCIKTNKGSLKPGKDADVVVIDPKESYVIDVKDFVSKGKNTPFQGKKVNGKVKVTICGGRVVYEDK